MANLPAVISIRQTHRMQDMMRCRATSAIMGNIEADSSGKAHLELDGQTDDNEWREFDHRSWL